MNRQKHEARIFSNALSITDVLSEEREWIKVVPVGVFPVHRQGAHEVTAEHIEQMADNFSNSGTDLLFDYEHKSLWGDSLAAGWSPEVEAREDGLYCKYPTFTNKATQHIEDKEYRYLSPVYQLSALEKDGRDIGAVLLSVGLTNTPYFDREIDGIGNSVHGSLNEPQTQTDQRTDMKLSKENLKKLGLPEDATEEQVNDALANSEFAPVEDPETKEKQGNPAPSPQGGGGAQASDEENDRIAKLEARLAEREQADLAEKAETLVNSAIKEGKILPRDRAAYVRFANSDFDSAKEAIDNLKANSVKPEGVQVNNDPGKGEGNEKVNSTQAAADYIKSQRAAK